MDPGAPRQQPNSINIDPSQINSNYSNNNNNNNNINSNINDSNVNTNLPNATPTDNTSCDNANLVAETNTSDNAARAYNWEYSVDSLPNQARLHMYTLEVAPDSIASPTMISWDM